MKQPAAILPWYLIRMRYEMEFTEKEQAILRIVQKNLPDTLTPYADIAAATGTTEEEVLALLQRLKDCGAIRRFGASIKHQRTGHHHKQRYAKAHKGIQ